MAVTIRGVTFERSGSLVLASGDIDELRAFVERAEQQAEAAADKIVMDVAEIPDRNSPEDQPEMMLVTGDELRNIVIKNLTE